MDTTRLCHLRFEERDEPKIEMVEEGSRMLLSKDLLGIAGRVFFVNRVSCVFRELNWTRSAEPQSGIFRRSQLREESIMVREESVLAWVWYFSIE